MLCLELRTHAASNLQAKWTEGSSRLIKAEIEPEFSHLAAFVDKGATVALERNTAFGKLVSSRPGGFKTTLRKSKNNLEDEFLPKAKVLGTQGTNYKQAPEVQPVPKPKSNTQETSTVCPFCNWTQSMEKCFKFRDKSFNERRDFVMTRKLCLNCLRENHLARRC